MAEKILDQDRADFEAAYVAEKLRIIGSEGSADGEKAIRAVMLRRNADGEYDNSLEAHFAWWAWQAARRAVPAGWSGGFAADAEKIKFLIERLEDVEDAGPRGAGWQSDELVNGIAELKRMLAAAPDLK